MIDFFYWPTPNGWKIAIMLEECGIPYDLWPVDIGKGQQFAPTFLAISPNNRIPAIVDHEPNGGGSALPVFESGAILLYLAEKTGRFLAADSRERYSAIQWVMWQMGGLGPIAGQNGHFLLHAKERVPYAIDRFGKEINRLYGVLDSQLQKTGSYVAGNYSIADMAIFPWIWTHKVHLVDLVEFPNVQRWFDRMMGREAVNRALKLGKDLRELNMDGLARRARLNHAAAGIQVGNCKE